MIDTFLCDDYHVLEAVRIIKYVVTVLKIVLPILLILMGSFDMFQAVVDPDKSELKTRLFVFSKRLISAAIIFLLPSIINIVFSLITDLSDFANMLTTCSNRATAEYIGQLKEAKRQQLLSYNKDVEYNVTYDISKYVIEKAEENEEAGNAGEGKTHAVADCYEFIMKYEVSDESILKFCDAEKTQYKAYSIGDGVVTIGYGITDQVMDVSLGDCVDREIVDQKLMDIVDNEKTQIEKWVEEAGITDWDEGKTSAAASLGYNCGSSYAKKVVQGYAANGDEGALSAFKSCTRASNGDPAFTEGLKTRRDGEYELFLTGNYDVGHQARKRKYIQ